MRRAVLCLLCCLMFGLGLRAQMTPEDAVRNFRLPRYGEDGWLNWLLEGRRGLFVNEDEIDVVGMRLRVFQPGAGLIVQTEIEAPQATFYLSENRATGSDSIRIRGNQFTLTGELWTWDGETDTVIIERQGEIRFQGNFLNILD